ncbi:MAG TPA: ATP-binding cassette domain-containing protein, partial [Thermoanaerobacterales bacterium]|nr:ATP-binding cassette domain-containing protein [Thermoanaerobacterales bacterium]
MPSISLRNISTSYSIKDVNLEVDDGEFMVILGPSGAGKSTILN